MDDADRAEIQRQRDTDVALQHRRRVPEIKARGTCYWCEAPVGAKQRFCDRFCADEFERAWTRGEIDYAECF